MKELDNIFKNNFLAKRNEIHIILNDFTFIQLLKYENELGIYSLIQIGNSQKDSFVFSVSGFPTLKNLDSYFKSLPDISKKENLTFTGLSRMLEQVMNYEAQFGVKNYEFRHDAAFHRAWFRSFYGHINLVDTYGSTIKNHFENLVNDSIKSNRDERDYSKWPRKGLQLDDGVADMVFDKFLINASLWNFLERSFRVTSAKLKSDADFCFKNYPESYLAAVDLSRFYFEMADIAQKGKESFLKYVN